MSPRTNGARAKRGRAGPVRQRKALFCSYGPPRHDRDSGSRRFGHLLEILRAEGWAVTFLTANSFVEDRYVADLRRSGIPVYDASEIRVDDLVEHGSFDLALCTFWQVAELYAPAIRRLSPSTRIVVDSVDVQLVRNARRILGSGGANGAPGRMLDREFADAAAAELNVYAAADAVLTVSREERDFVDGLVGVNGLAHWVPDGEDMEASSRPFEDRQGILFMGSFRHGPNLDAVAWLSKEVVPLLDPELLERHPISVCGDGLDGPAGDALRSLDHVSVVGWVPKLEPYLEQTRISVIPLRYGAGTKRKTLQSLLLGTPVVSTTVGVEGLDLRPGVDALVADDPGAFAAAITRLVDDRALWRKLARNGRRQVVSDHSIAAARQRFREAIDAALGSERRPPNLPEFGRERYEERLRYEEHQRVAPALGELLAGAPADARVAVVSGGSDELLHLGSRLASHFPPDGRASDSPADSGEAIELVEREVASGGEFLLFPTTSEWWLDHYPDLARHLYERFTVSRSSAGIVVDLRPGRPAVDEQEELGDEELPVRLIAFYLPQFHPIPENDEWWGPGFTEWTNVTRARPLFPGHAQPHVPGELGFYDLRLAETRAAQARLAREAGIAAFCYYHYWFGGRRLLERPFDEVLASGEPDLPFCLCWANEPWSRRWDGSDDEVLQPQFYGEEDDVEHIRWLIPALSDPRALTVEGRPVFIVYQAKELPDPARTTDVWRREARAAGLSGLHLIAVETGWDEGWDATRVGFDAKVLFQPQFSILSTVPRSDVPCPESLRVFDYAKAWPVLSRPRPAPYRRYETVCAGWDNSPRRGEDGWVLHGSTPEEYAAWLREAVDRAQREPPEHRLVFLNAWNEWAEGAHLEPDLDSGRAYLDATRDALRAATRPRDRIHPVPHGERAPADRAGKLEERRARAIAFYLPQFHPIPENDEWWTKGFTEWTNVVRAEPRFPGHYQPHLPADLGFYDLRVAEVRAAQAALARRHGIEAFCYWHYWFGGRRLLERPLDDMLASGEPDFPFCLAWANESWSRRWLGEDRDILIPQEYSPEDDIVHARWLARVFADPRYVRIDGRPLFLVYRPGDIPDPKRTTETLRAQSIEAGVGDPFLLGVNSFQDADFRTMGFDGSIDFEPWLGALDGVLSANGLVTCDYAEARRLMRRARTHPAYPSVVVSWDNTARRGSDGIVLLDATPETFAEALAERVDEVASLPNEHRLVFLNAWNEWAEGNHLEPDQRFGLGYLEAVRRVVAGTGPGVPFASERRTTPVVLPANVG